MIPLLVSLLLAAPGTIRSRVDGDATEVVAFKDGVERARAPVVDGVALLEDLPPDEYDLRAEGAGAVSAPVRGVRPVADGAEGFDAVLEARPAFPVRIETDVGATVWSDGLPFPLDAVRLPAGFHRILVDHPEKLSSAERIVRVEGPVSLAIPLDAGLAVSGRVVNGDGDPVAGAQVEVFADGLPARRTTHADATGRFGLSGFAGDVVSLYVTAPGFASRLERLVFHPGSARTHVEVTLEAGSAATLVAPVRAEALLLPAWFEASLEEPRVRANHRPVRVRGGPGTLRFAGLTPGREYRVVVSAPGWRPATTRSFVAPKAGETLPLGPVVHRPGAVIRGRAVGAPPGAVVVCQGPEGTHQSRADRAGRYRFDGLDPGEHILWVRDVDETGAKITLAAGEKRAFDLPCEPPGGERFLTGLVFDAANEPLPGVVVESSGRSAVTDAEGKFRLDGLPRGPDRVAVNFVPGPGCRALGRDPHLPHIERKVTVGTDVRVRLPKAASLWVELDAGDRTLTRARLRIASATGDVRLQRRMPRGAREVRVDDLPAGAYRVEVAAPGVLGTGGAVVEVAPEPAAPTPLKVLPGRAVRGRVTLKNAVRQAGAAPTIVEIPLDRGVVTLLDSNPMRALAIAPVEPDGSFFLEGLPADAVVLCASAPGLPVATVRVDLTAGDADDVAIALEPGSEAAVRVTASNGTALPNARVRVIDAMGVDIRDVAALGRFQRVVAGESDLDAVVLFFRLARTKKGRIAASFVLPGSYRFLVAADGYKSKRVGVRARSAWTLDQLRENLTEEFKASFPGGPPDLARPVQLEAESPPGD